MDVGSRRPPWSLQGAEKWDDTGWNVTNMNPPNYNTSQQPILVNVPQFHQTSTIQEMGYTNIPYEYQGRNIEHMGNDINTYGSISSGDTRDTMIESLQAELKILKGQLGRREQSFKMLEQEMEVMKRNQNNS